ncbi:TolC family protein [Halarcobacter sp.]|uniref:TolC family protein n=1 Tax=Halarcobacter sp. TaxID=2321133 RepID=UPI0029F4D83C|nr:TolC family protein [Halarcobacter sp.]
MYKVLFFLLLYSIVYSNDLQILNKDKKELREVEKRIIQEQYKSSNNSWIGGVDLSSSLNRSHSFSTESDKFTKSVSIGFSQSLYESGGIEFSIKNAKDTLNEQLIAWENENLVILKTIYETLLSIKKLKLQIEQNEFTYKNKEIELALKKIQYEAGDVDITELNDAIMAKNTQFKNNIALKNSLKDALYELSKYTDLKYEEIEILDFKPINKEDFINNSIDLKYENAKINTLDSSYKELKSSYGLQVNFSSSLSYSESDELNEDTNSRNKSGSLGLNFSLPLFDATKKYELEKSRLEILKQKVNLSDIKKELLNEYDQILTQIDTYEKYFITINENLELYEDLILINSVSNSAGMSSDYDLEILKNTKKINEYDLEINDIDMQLQYSKLYFMTKVDS